MIYFGLYLFITIFFLLWWKSAYYKIPYEEVRFRPRRGSVFFYLLDLQSVRRN